MRNSDWSSNVCSSDLRPSRQFVSSPVRNRSESLIPPSPLSDASCTTSGALPKRRPQSQTSPTARAERLRPKVEVSMKSVLTGLLAAAAVSIVAAPALAKASEKGAEVRPAARQNEVPPGLLKAALRAFPQVGHGDDRSEEHTSELKSLMSH